MSIISKEAEIQEELATIFELIIHEKESIKVELTCYRNEFDMACNNFINDGFANEDDWISARKQHQLKFTEYETYCHIIEIVSDFRDIQGKFPDYKEMHFTLQQIMIEFARLEKYELAAITKRWVDKINEAILN